MYEPGMHTLLITELNHQPMWGFFKYHLNILFYFYYSIWEKHQLDERLTILTEQEQNIQNNIVMLVLFIDSKSLLRVSE